MEMHIQPDILIIPPYLYKRAERILNTKRLDIQCGNYCKYQYKNEKPYWIKGYYVLSEGKSPKLEDMIRDNCWNGYYEDIKNLSLPKAMRKQGYVIKCRYVGYGEYSKWIEKAIIHNKCVIEELEFCKKRYRE